ncbi:sensor histidine kinase [Lactobacillus delbrueckii]|uniref:sensor histidine kinase n=1 Tax=Lactobacillus delbrueckii TaxID=1584 RepID=UPI0005599775|nr:HAMP domain-containing sensor histidine kinase [Lactobacillus delbrueckii]
MKLIYQHILSFLIVILTSVMIIGFSTINYQKEQAYQSNYTRLESYAENLSTLQLYSKKTQSKNSPPVFSADFLQKFSFVMRDENLKLFLMDKNFKTTYPLGGYDILKKSAKSMLKKGKVVQIKDDHSSEQRDLAPKVQGRVKHYGLRKRSNRLFAAESYTWVVVPQVQGSGSNKKAVGAIMIGSRVKDVLQTVSQAKANLARALVITFAVSLILSFILAYYQTGRIKKLSLAARKVADGDLDVQVDHRHADEIDDLAENFNEMVRSLKASNEEVKAQEERRDQFMQDVAHEMRTPLTTINGLLEGMKYDAIPEESIPESIDLMSRETKRLIRLVNENLDYEKIRSGKIQMMKSQFNARTIMNDVQQQLTQNAAKNGDKIILDAPEDLPIYADQDRFKQMLVNLTQNAIQFTNNGTITLRGRRFQHGATFSVQDTGIGMTQEQSKYIFERFYKADPARARYGGTGESGLGLSIVLSLVRQHGGEIKVISKPHEGSTFMITLFDQGHEKHYDKKDKKESKDKE